MKKTRQQLTLFLNPKQAAPIEIIRKTYNPLQHQLIKSHVTLCREDEIQDLERVQHNLLNLSYEKFELWVGSAERFSAGKGVFLPIMDKEGKFKKLRELVLKDTTSKPRQHEAHITLMHPRNSTCTDRVFEAIKGQALPPKIEISSISLIEQEIGKVWHSLQSYHLTA